LDFPNSLFFSLLFSTPEDNCIQFDEFAQVLSIMVRGTFEQKIDCMFDSFKFLLLSYLMLLVSFAICDLDRSGYVEREEVLQVRSNHSSFIIVVLSREMPKQTTDSCCYQQITNQLSSILGNLGFDQENFGSPSEVIDNLFRKANRESSVDLSTSVANFQAGANSNNNNNHNSSTHTDSSRSAPGIKSALGEKVSEFRSKLLQQHHEESSDQNEEIEEKDTDA
jgi:hypothetical protein